MPKTKSKRIANKRQTKQLRGGETELSPSTESHHHIHDKRDEKKSASNLGAEIGVMVIAIIGVLTFVKSKR
jgi:hypothetical protein